MGIFGRGVGQRTYLNVLLRYMTDQVSDLYPGNCPVDRGKATGFVGSSLATIVSLYVIADYVNRAEQSRFSAKRLRQASRLVADAKSRAWTLAEMQGLNMNDVIEIGQTESREYLRWIGGDSTYQHERGFPGHMEYRRDAVCKVDPALEQAATDALFESIVKRSMGE